MVRQFAKFEWKQFFRSPYWQKSIALNVLLVFLGLYFIAVFFGLGISIYPLLKKQFPESDPLILVNGFLFYWFLGDLMLRFFLQKLPVMNIKPMLTLPIKKSSILHYVLGKSAVSFFNFLPLFAVIPFGIILMSQNYETATVLSWMLLMFVFSMIINFLNFIIESKSAETELSFLPIILLGSVLFAINYFEILSLTDLIG